MATNYVDYVASPEEPDLDAMRYMLAQRNALPTATPAVDLPSQIPGVQPAPAPQRPLDRVTEQFRRMGQSMNPLLMAKSLQDVATTAVVNPLLMPASIVGEVATGRPVTGSLLARPPQTPLGQDFAEALYGGLEAAKVPHMWPLTPRPAGARPMLTPNDVRVMGAQAAHAVREASQIPTDIANVRGAGVQRLSPLTGEPSIGSRIGTAIEGTSQAAGKVGDLARDVGQSTADYMQMRRDMGLSPVPGVPAEFMPDLNMYAVRPRGSSLVYPTVPPTKNITTLAQGTAPHELIEATGAQNALKSQDALSLLTEFNLDAPAGTSRQVAEQRQQAFDSFVAAKAQSLYPDAPSATEAQHAMYAPFSRADEKAAFALKLYDEFRASPEGQAVGAQSLPSSQELQDRHAAAGQWLNTTFLNYIKKHVGAEGDPLVQLASQGLTAVAPDILGSVRVSDVDLTKKRAKAGMPQESMLAPAIEAKAEEVAAAEIAVRKLETQRNQYRDVAMQQGLADPALLPEYAATTNPLTAAVAKRDKLRTDLANLELGKRYESIADMAITVTPQSDLQARLDYPERQFYPSITRAQPTDMLATASQAGALERTGLGEVAARVYDDVIRGVIPTQDLKNLTVDKYVRRMATGRIERERQEAAALQQMKTDAEARMLDYTQQYVKPENRIGNTNILELHRDSGIDPTTIAQIISDDTAVLDHCVGEGGTPGAKQINPWSGEKRNYGVLYNPATGEKNPDASRSSTSYIAMAQQGPGMISSVRDANTGLPVATLEFRSTSSLGKFSLGYASGYHNGPIKPEYHAAVLQYLNNMADRIKSTDSSRLASNLNALDTQSPDFIDDAGRALGVSRQRVKALPSMPRFVSQQDLRNALAAVEAQSTAQQPVTTATAVLRDVNSAIDTAIAEAELPDAVAARARERFDALLANHQMDENGFSPERFDAFIDAVDNTAGDLAAQSSNNAILMADAFANAMDALDGIRNQAMRGMYERQPAASAAAQPVTTAVLRDVNSAIDSAIAEAGYANPQEAELRRVFDGMLAERGMDVGEVSLPQLDAFIRTVEARRQNYLRQGSILVDAFDSVMPALQGIRDQMSRGMYEQQPAGAQQPQGVTVQEGVRAQVGAGVPAGAVAAQQPAAAQQNVTIHDLRQFIHDIAQGIGTDEGRAFAAALTRARESFDFVGGRFSFTELLRDQPTAFAERIAEIAQQQDNAIVEQELLALADRIAPPVPPAQPAIAQQITTIDDYRNHVNNAFIGLDQNALRDFVSALNTAGEMPIVAAMLRDQPAVLAARLVEIAGEQPSVLVGHELLRLADRIAPRAQQPEPNVNLGDFEPDPGHPANRPGYADEAITRLQLRMLGRNELVQQVDPGQWDMLTERVDAAIQGVDPQNAATLADDIREGRATDITNGLTAVEREIVARDAQQLLELNQQHRAAAVAEPQFANNFNPTDFARNLVEDARLDNRHFDIQLLRNQANLLTEDPGSFMSIQALPLEQHTAAARRAQAELRNLMRPLEAQINQRYSALQDAIGREDVQELRALRTALGEDDHPYWGALPAQERENVIRTLTAGIADLEQRPPQQPANNPNIAPFRRIPAEVRAMDSAALHQGMTHGQYQEALSVATQLMNNNDVADLRDIMQLVRNHTIGAWELFSPEQREYLARELQNHIDNPPQGYQKGGRVEYPNPLFAQSQAIERAQEMYPTAYERDDAADAARHMLAAGYMSKSLSPGVAKALGWAHEAKEAPFRTIGHALGLSQPRYDYEMDMHNNALGVELAKKAKDRADFERLVQESIRQGTTTTQPGRARLMTPKQAEAGIAALKYANGGTVSQPQSLDAMKYELMMRSK